MRYATTGDVTKRSEEEKVGRKDIEGVATVSVARVNLRRIGSLMVLAVESPKTPSRIDEYSTEEIDFVKSSYTKS
jgi:hypothetical protein